MFIQKRKITAAEEVEEEVVEEVDVEVAPEATDLLFEAEDVAELIAEVTDQVVNVDIDGEDVIFNVGGDEFVVTPEGDEELLEASTKVMKSACKAACGADAKKKTEEKKPVKANTNTQKRVIRKVSK